MAIGTGLALLPHLDEAFLVGRVLEIGALDDAAGRGIVVKEPRDVILLAQGDAECVNGELYGALPDDPIIHKVAQVKDLFRNQRTGGPGQWVVIPVPDPPGALHLLGRYPVGMHRNQLIDGTALARDDLSIGVAAKLEMTLQHLLKLECGLLVIRSGTQQRIDWMSLSGVLYSLRVVGKDSRRRHANIAANNRDAGQHRSDALCC